jgi:hypothetical protein
MMYYVILDLMQPIQTSYCKFKGILMHLCENSHLQEFAAQTAFLHYLRCKLVCFQRGGDLVNFDFFFSIFSDESYSSW